MKTILVLAACILAASAYQPFFLKDAPENRIINGNVATETDFPHQVGLFVRLGGQKGFKCGGALLSPRIVLSAAHCFEKSQYGTASLGSTTYMQGVIIEFSHVKIHEDFILTPKYIANDIALVFLDEDAPIDDVTIKTIALDKNPLPDNSRMLVSGFGKIGDKVDTSTLFWVPLTSIPNDDCIFNIADSAFCAVGENLQSTCHGDSGGPIVTIKNGEFLHVGIVSFVSSKSCVLGLPAGFTRTASFIPWIEANMKF